MLLKEGMVNQLLDWSSVIRVLLQAAVKEIADLGADGQIARDFDFIFDYFDELLFSGYFKWVLADNHLIHHDPDWPNIDLLIVLFPFEDLGADVEWGTAKGCPEFVVLVNRPPEVAKFDNVLSKEVTTSWRTIFSGLMSLCMIFKEWI